MKNKQLLAVAAAATTAGLVLAGCSAGGGSDSGKVTLEVASFIGGDQEPGGLPELVDKFEQENPDIDVDFKFVANADYATYMSPRFAAGTAPDVFLSGKYWATQWAPDGYLLDLGDQPWVSRQVPEVIPFVNYSGKTVVMMTQNIPVGLYANLDLLKSVGIDSVPTDWPSFIADLQTLKDAGKNGLLMPGGATGWDATQMSLGLGANLVSADWAPNFDAGTKDSAFYPTWTPVADRIQELFQKGYVDGTAMGGIDPFSQGVQMFTGGDWAFYYDGGWDLAHFKSEGNFDVSLNPMPGGDAGTQPQGNTFFGAGWSVYSQTKQKEAAGKFLDFLSQPENDAVFLKAESSFTTFSDVESPQVAGSEAMYEAFGDGRLRNDDLSALNDANAGNIWQKQFALYFTNPNTSPEDVLKPLDEGVVRTTLEAK